MPEGDDAIAVAVGERADGREVHVAAHEVDGDRGPGRQRLARGRRAERRRHRARGRRPPPPRTSGEAVGLGPRVRARPAPPPRSRPRPAACAGARDRRGPGSPTRWPAGWGSAGPSSKPPPGARSGVVHDGEHVGDGLDAAQRIARERPAERERADQLAVDVDRAAAHAGGDAVVLHAAALRAGEDHRALGAAAREPCRRSRARTPRWCGRRRRCGRRRAGPGRIASRPRRVRRWAAANAAGGPGDGAPARGGNADQEAGEDQQGGGTRGARERGHARSLGRPSARLKRPVLTARPL